jgi:predicted transcriptional regulator
MRPLGELEAAVMEQLWAASQPLLVRDVVDALEPSRPLAYTTVMTVMDNLHRKGWLGRQRDGRAWRYQAAKTRGAYTAELMRDALSTSEDRGPALAQFVAQMSPADAALLRLALDEASAGAPAEPEQPSRRGRRSRSR